MPESSVQNPRVFRYEIRANVKIKVQNHTGLLFWYQRNYQLQICFSKTVNWAFHLQVSKHL